MKTTIKKTSLLILALLLVLGLAAGCGQDETTTTTASQGDAETEDTAGTTSQGDEETDAGDLTGMYQIAGSDTEVNMVQRLTEVYSEDNADVVFAVTGGGSGTGIASLIDNQIDVANSSRPMKDEEISQAEANGVDPVAFIFAQDGLAVIVNENNPIEQLDLDQIGAIFRGEITNWSEVGGNDQEISTYGRQSSSGTYVYFMETVVKGDYSSNKKMLSGNANIVEGVMADQAGIGYVGIGYAADGGQAVSGLKVLNVSAAAGGEASSPLEIENILGGKYPIVRPLFHYTNGVPQGALKSYLEFVFSDEGQAVIEEEGFFPITDEHQALNQANLQS